MKPKGDPCTTTVRIELWAKYREYKGTTLENKSLHDIKKWIRDNGRNADYAIVWIIGPYGWKKRCIFNVSSHYDWRPLNAGYIEATQWQSLQVD